MSKYKQLIKEARKTVDSTVRQADNNRKSDDSDPGVNLSIKVAASRRRHWAAEAKRQGTTLTAAITAALSEKFGEPQE